MRPRSEEGLRQPTWTSRDSAPRGLGAAGSGILSVYLGVEPQWPSPGWFVCLLSPGTQASHPRRASLHPPPRPALAYFYENGHWALEWLTLLEPLPTFLTLSLLPGCKTRLQPAVPSDWLVATPDGTDRAQFQKTPCPGMHASGFGKRNPEGWREDGSAHCKRKRLLPRSFPPASQPPLLHQDTANRSFAPTVHPALDKALRTAK